MLKRLYIHNFRCMENFEFTPNTDNHSLLLIGKNGSGKTTVSKAIKIFQAIGRGNNRVGTLIDKSDYCLGRTSNPINLEIEATLNSETYSYSISFELPDNFKEARVLDETVKLNGKTIYSRELAQVFIPRQLNFNKTEQTEAKFGIDWHIVALSIIQNSSSADSLEVFRKWLANMVVLSPIPRLMSSFSTNETVNIEEDGKNFADWLRGLLAESPSSYQTMSTYLQQVMPDFSDFTFDRIGKDSKLLLINFKDDNSEYQIDFDSLSDGEKCFFLCALVLAANKHYGPLFVFWDEPDNYLAIDEVSQFITGLRQSFNKSGQIIMTSHNEETIRRFSNENTWLLSRKSHFLPTRIKNLSDLQKSEDLISSLIIGDIE